MGLTEINTDIPGVGRKRVEQLQDAGIATAFDVLQFDAAHYEPWEQLVGIGESLWTSLLDWATDQAPDHTYYEVKRRHGAAYKEHSRGLQRTYRDARRIIDELESQLQTYVHETAEDVDEPELLRQEDIPDAWFRLNPDGNLTLWSAIFLAFPVGGYAVDLAPDIGNDGQILVNIVAAVVGWFIGYLVIFMALSALIKMSNLRLDSTLAESQRTCEENNQERMAINATRWRAYEADVERARAAVWSRDDLRRCRRHFMGIKAHHEEDEYTLKQELDCLRDSGPQLRLDVNHPLNTVFKSLVEDLRSLWQERKNCVDQLHRIDETLEDECRRLGVF